jgi:predicted acyltransferase
VDVTAWIYNNCFMPMAGNYAGSFLYALTFTLICWFAGWILYRKKIFIKL